MTSALLVTFIVAALLRCAPSAVAPRLTDPVRQYPAVAAAIGLTDDLPPGSVLATYLYAFGYGALERVAAPFYPRLSALDFCVAFTRDPASFAALARFVTAAAGVLAVVLLYLLVARLIDPWTGVAAALLLAIHPAAVGLSRSLTSDIFCLVCLLGGLIVFVAAARGSMRLFDFLPAGLLLGFATESFPAAWLIALALVGGLVAPTAAAPTATRSRPRALRAAALCTAAFALATVTVAQHLDIVFLVLVRAAIATLVVAAAVALMRHLHDTVPRPAWAGLIVGGSLLVSVAGLSAPGVPQPVPVLDPPLAASEWIAAELPPGAVVGVDVRLADHLVIPRTAASWQREFVLPDPRRPHPPAIAAAGLKAALDSALPAWDLIFTAPVDASPAGVEDLLGSPAHVEYLVVPDAPPGSSDLTHLGLWVVARFRPESGGGPGIAIWGAMPDSAPTVSPSVRWHIGQAHATS